MEFEIRPFDPQAASEADWQVLDVLESSYQAEIYPEDPPTPLELRRRQWLTEVPEMRRFTWLAVDPREEAAGFAVCELEDLEENNHLAFSRLYVAPQHRRQGLGSRLLGCMAGCAQADGRRTLIGAFDDSIPAGGVFAKRAGCEIGMEAHHRQLDLTQLQRELLLAWQARAAGLRASGDYKLVSMYLPYPEAELEQLCHLIASMNDAPRGSLDMADQKWTPELLRQTDAFHMQRGTERWTIAARHRPSGAFAGYTEIYLYPDNPQVGFQGATSVRPEFRNQGLGRWLKAEMALKVLAERPQIRYLRTTNADVNAPMLKINDEMGFKVHHARIWVQAPVATLVGYVRI